MTYTVSPFYVDASGGEHPWGETFVIGAGDLHDYRVGARDFMERLLETGQPGGHQPLGMRILGPDDEVVFTYVRPAPAKSDRPA